MSSIQTNIGTNFNFKLENGLPYKPGINVDTKIFSQKQNKNAGIVHFILNPHSVGFDISNINIESINVDKDNIYLDIGNFYLIGENNSDLIYNSAENKTLVIKLYNNTEFLFAIGFDE